MRKTDKDDDSVMDLDNYAPNFEEVLEAYWFGPVRPSVRLCVTLALGQEPLEIGY